MSRRSAGIVLHREVGGRVEVLLGHMGGPFWARKDAGAWSIPKGEYEEGEDPLTVARREFEEEIGVPVPATEFVELGEIRQSGAKRVVAWAAAGDLDASSIVSNTFELEWPPRSGRIEQFPEIDRAAWFDLDTAMTKIVTAQRQFLTRLITSGSAPGGDARGHGDDP
jgi:predicted NUDIX family NTP pyrophosphohydrolase